MRSRAATADSRLSLWRRVREFAVPPSMIESATARRRAGDGAGACAAAGVDVEFDLRSLARTHGRELAARVRADLRRLAPDLLRWHLPRIAPDGLLRPGLTVALARYEAAGHAVHLVARTPPAWADAGQRFGLALWPGAGDRRHPHPHPDRRFRLDLHRHLWDARRADELRSRSGVDRLPADAGPPTDPGALPPGWGCAVDRWTAEAAILLRAEGRTEGAVGVHLGGRRRLVLHLPTGGAGPRVEAAAGRGGAAALPVLPDAATWVPPDLELLRAGLIDLDRLHPLVASALATGDRTVGAAPAPDRRGGPRLVWCRGARHRIGLVDGVLTALDHDPAEIRREELLVALSGTSLPCLRAIDEAHRRPECLDDVRARLDHGDTAGALATVEALLGPDALLRAGALREELETAAQRRVTYGLFRAGLAGHGPGPAAADRRRTRDRRSRPRHALPR